MFFNLHVQSLKNFLMLIILYQFFKIYLETSIMNYIISVKICETLNVIIISRAGKNMHSKLKNICINILKICTIISMKRCW